MKVLAINRKTKAPVTAEQSFYGRWYVITTNGKEKSYTSSSFDKIFKVIKTGIEG